MTSKLKCPFCGEELGGNMAEPCCRNQNCEMNAIPIPRTIWEKLIQAKQDLVIATKALEDITKEHSAFADWVFKAVTMKSIAEKALEQIEHKDKQ